MSKKIFEFMIPDWYGDEICEYVGGLFDDVEDIVENEVSNSGAYLEPGRVVKILCREKVSEDQEVNPWIAYEVLVDYEPVYYAYLAKDEKPLDSAEVVT
jgi:hypothetical protein